MATMGERMLALEQRVQNLLSAVTVSTPSRSIGVPFIVAARASFVQYTIFAKNGKGVYLFFIEGLVAGALDVEKGHFGVFSAFAGAGHQVLIQLSSGSPGIVTSREVVFNG